MREGDLKKAIENGANMLHGLAFANPHALLSALATVESSYGSFNVPRFEPVYAPAGRYFNSDQKLRYDKFGAWACCSYSSFQIMYPTACELGYDRLGSRSPDELCNDEVAIHWVVEYIKQRVLAKGVTSIEQFCDAYNTGTHKDNNVPLEYISKFRKAYDKFMIGTLV